jgi:hypothetical protein
MKREYLQIHYEGFTLPLSSVCTSVELTVSRRAISKLLNDRLNRPIDENAGQKLEDVEALQQVMNILIEEIEA